MTKEKKKNIIIAIAIPLLCFFAAQTGYYRTKCGNMFKGVSAKMAARIAEAVWFTEFNDTIIEKRPIQVYKEKNCWLVFSARNMGYRGRPCMEIDCKDGRIISYRFEK